MQKLITMALVCAAAMTAGCATPSFKDWQASSFSRTDASILLSYEYRETEIPMASELQAIQLAKQHCSAWGYSDAEAFEGMARQCIKTAGQNTSCGLIRVDKQYQCTKPATKPLTDAIASAQ